MNVKDVYATLGGETYKSSQMKMIDKTTIDSVEFWFNRRDFFFHCAVPGTGHAEPWKTSLTVALRFIKIFQSRWHESCLKRIP